VADASLRYHSDFYLTKPVLVERLVWKAGELVNGRAVGRVDDEGSMAPLLAGERPYTTDPGQEVQQGDLADFDPAMLAISFYLHRRSGSLVVTHGNKVRQIAFQEGFPFAADSNAHGEEFGSFAVSIGTCDGSDMVRARGAWQHIDRHLGVVAVSHGVMGARDLFRTMRLHVETVLINTLSMTEGQFFLEYGAPPANFDGVALPSLPTEYVMRAIRQVYGEERCMALLGDAAVPMVASRYSHFVIRELEDTAYYENILEMFTYPVSLEELISEGRLRRGTGQLESIFGLRTIGALWLAGATSEQHVPRPVTHAVDLGFDKPDPTPPEPGPDRQPPPEQRAPRSAPRAAARRPARQPSQQDAVLETDRTPVVPPRDRARELHEREAGDAAQGTGARTSAGKTPLARVVPVRKEIRKGLQPASESGSPVVDYQHGKQPQEPRNGGLDIQRMTREELSDTTAEASAEQHFVRATEAFSQGNYQGAIGDLDRAIANQSGRAIYHALLAQCILLMPESNEAALLRAVDNLKTAIRLEPRRGDSYHFLGVALIGLGRRQEAQLTLRKAIQLGTSHKKEARRLLSEL
jgi:Domain of unknown function (DUF4388)